MRATLPSPRQNWLLASLPAQEYSQLEPSLEPVRLELRQALHEPGSPITHVYFPLTAVVSLLVMEEPRSLAAAMVGRQGVVGLPLFLGQTTSVRRALCQVPGQAVRLGAGDFQIASQEGRALRPLLLRYANAMLVETTQAAACSGLHTVEQRCARWLLQTGYAGGADAFPLTHDFLGQMLAIRRQSVTESAGRLQRAGFIRYTSGRLTIADPVGLEGMACGCYRIIRDELDRLSQP